MQDDNNIDLLFLTEFCKGNKEKMKKYIQSFLESYSQQTDEIYFHANNKNWEALKTAVHSFKPQLTFVGLNALHDLAAKIENEIMNEQSPLKIIDLASDFKSKMDEASKLLIETFLKLH